DSRARNIEAPTARAFLRVRRRYLTRVTRRSPARRHRQRRRTALRYRRDRRRMSDTDQSSHPPIDDRFAARLRGFGPIGILAILIILSGNFVIAPLSAVLALIWVRASNTP